MADTNNEGKGDMSMRKRGQMRSRTSMEDNRRREEFIEGAEKPRERDMTVQERVRKRQQSGRPFGALMLRLTEEQKALLEYVSQQERISMQKLVEVPIMEKYEEEFGERFDQHRKRVQD